MEKKIDEMFDFGDPKPKLKKMLKELKKKIQKKPKPDFSKPVKGRDYGL